MEDDHGAEDPHERQQPARHGPVRERHSKGAAWRGYMEVGRRLARSFGPRIPAGLHCVG